MFPGHVEGVLIDHPPFRVGRFDLVTARPARQWASAPWRSRVHQQRGIGGGDRAHLATDRLALRPREAVHGPEVEHQAEAGADARGPERRHVALEEARFDAGLPCPLPCGADGLRDHVDPRDVPSAPG
jgi:hypothetical protein